MARLLLIAGNTGAGKSRHAAKLAQELDVHFFAVDEWVKSLFVADMLDPPSCDLALERPERIEAQILKEALRLAERGVNVILDLGFFDKTQRIPVKDFFKRQGHEAVVHYLDVDKNTRWQGIQRRNATLDEASEVHVSKEVFEFCESIFEPLDDEELEDAVVVGP